MAQFPTTILFDRKYLKCRLPGNAKSKKVIFLRGSDLFHFYGLTLPKKYQFLFIAEGILAGMSVPLRQIYGGNPILFNLKL
jgi:hypothetical protein